MGLNDVPQSERVNIGFFGRRNAGKSSLVNLITNQKMSVVSETAGTTTDPVTKAMEILPLGPVVIIDTPGYDDEGELGSLRIQRTKEILGRVDIAVMVTCPEYGIGDCEKELIGIFREGGTPYLIVCNKSEELSSDATETPNGEEILYTSCMLGKGINELKDKLASLAPKTPDMPLLIADMISEGDIVILVIPIDKSAPKGRIILPQQQVLREVLDCGAAALCVQTEQLGDVLTSLGKKPRLVVTDSQAFAAVSQIVPEDVKLTSFSILLARHKGLLRTAVRGAALLPEIKTGDKVLICEACTHHRTCEDIGTVKIPRLIKKFTGEEPDYEWTSGHGFTAEPGKYKLIIHCGACMIGDSELHTRMKQADKAGIPMTNYGIAIARMNGILERSLRPLPEYGELTGGANVK